MSLKKQQRNGIAVFIAGLKSRRKIASAKKVKSVKQRGTQKGRGRRCKVKGP